MARWLLRASSIGGLRPREWNQALVRIVLSDPTPNAASRRLKYNWYADTKQLSEAAAVLEWWLRQDLSPIEKAIWWYEASWFEAFSMSNPSAARERFKVAESFSGGRHVECAAWKARAAVAAREGRFSDAADSANRAQRALSYLPLDKGIAKAIMEDLSAILEAESMSKAIEA